MSHQKLDRVELHRYLHRKITAAGGSAPIAMTELADDLGTTAPHTGRVVQELVDAGRLRKVGRKAHNIVVYASVDPDEYEEEVEEQAKPKPRVPVWG